jgi:hypothetical protein
MGNKNRLQFMNYISTPLSDDTITILYSSNNVKFDRVELYFDFIISLLYLVFDTYMGDDITPKADQIKHFNWCWDKNISNFKNEDIIFENNDDLKSYFSEFTLEIFYNLGIKEDTNIHQNIIKLWAHIFNYKGVKSRADIDSFIEIYNIFDKSLKIV